MNTFLVIFIKVVIWLMVVGSIVGFVWFFYSLAREHRQHRALMRRMKQFKTWIETASLTSREHGLVQDTLCGLNPQYRGPWE